MKSTTTPSTTSSGIKKSIEKKVLALKDKNDSLETTNHQLNSVIAQQQQEIRTLETALELAKGHDAQQFYNFGAFQLEIQSLKDHQQKNNNEIVQLKYEKQQSDASLEEKTEQVNLLEQQKENLMSMIDSQRKELSTFKNTSDNLKDKTTQLKRADIEITRSRKEMDEFKTKMELLSKDLLQEKEAREKIEMDFEGYRESMTNENETLKEQLDQFAAMNFQYQKQVNELQSENYRLKDMTEGAVLRNKELEEVIKLLKEERKNSEEELCNRLKERIAQLTKLNTEKDSILTAQHELQFKFMEKEEALRQKEEYLDTLQQKISNQDENKKIMQKTLLQQLESLRKDLQQKDEEIANLKEYIEKADKDNNRLKILVKALKRNQEERAQKLGKEKGLAHALDISTTSTTALSFIDDPIPTVPSTPSSSSSSLGLEPVIVMPRSSATATVVSTPKQASPPQQPQPIIVTTTILEPPVLTQEQEVVGQLFSTKSPKISRKPLTNITNSTTQPTLSTYQPVKKTPNKSIKQYEPLPTPQHVKTLNELAMISPSPYHGPKQPYQISHSVSNKENICDMSVLGSPSFQRMDLFELADMK